MLGRLNGLYRGIFSVESWVLSQSYSDGASRRIRLTGSQSWPARQSTSTTNWTLLGKASRTLDLQHQVQGGGQVRPG